MSRRWLWIVLAMALGVAALAGAAWHAFPRIVRALALRQIEALTGRHATVDDFALDLVHGRLDITGFRLDDRAPGPPLAEFERLSARFKSRGLLRGRLHVTEAVLERPRLRIARGAAGEFNIEDLLAPTAGRGRWPGVIVDRFVVSGGSVILEDRSLAPARTWRADDIDAEIRGLSSVDPRARGSGRLTAAVAGAPLSVDVSGVGLGPLRGEVRLALRDVDAAAPVDVYLFSPSGPVTLESGRLTLALAAAADGRGGSHAEAHGTLDNLVLRPHRAGAPAARAPSLMFSLTGGQAPGQPLRLDRLEVTGAATIDAKPGGPSPVTIDRLRLLVEGADGGTSRVSLAAGLPGSGDLDVQGTARIASPGAQLRVRLGRLELALLAPYVALPVQVAGTAGADLSVEVDAAERLSVRARGRADVAGAAVTAGGRSLATADRLEVVDLDVNWPQLRAGRVRVVRPVALVERDAAGRFPAALLMTAPADPIPTGARSDGSSRTPESAPTETAGMTVEVGELTVDDGAITIADARAAPAAPLRVAPLALGLRDLTWPARRPARLHLKTGAPGGGTLEADGTIELAPARLDLRAQLARVALAPYQPYLPVAARLEGRADADVTVRGALASPPGVAVRGTAALGDLAIRDGDRRVLAADRVETTGLDYAWPARLVVDRVRIQKPRARIERKADGSFPLAALLRPQSPASRETTEEAPGGASPSPGASPQSAGAGATAPFLTPTSPPSGAGQAAAGASSGAEQHRSAISAVPQGVLDLTVREAVIEDGRATLIDAAVSPATRTALLDLRLVARDVTWPARRPSTLDLSVATRGGSGVRIEGQVDLPGQAADLRVALDALDLGLFRPYLPLRGRLSGVGSGNLQVKASREPRAIAVRGTAAVVNAALAAAEEPLLSAARVETTGLTYTWPAQLSMDQLRVQKVRAMLERRPDGSLPLLALLSMAGAAEPVSGSAAPAPALDFAIREVVVEDSAASVVDATLSPAARFDLAGLELVARDLSWPAGSPTTVRLRTSTPGGGTLRARGQADLAAQAADLQVTLDGVDIAPLRPYLALRGQLGGVASGDLQVKLTREPLAVTARGTASLANLGLSAADRPLLTVGRVEATGLDAAWPGPLTVDRLDVKKGWTLVERGADGSISLPALLAASRLPAPRAAPAAGGQAAGPGVSPPPFEIRVRRVSATEGGVTLVDASVKPAARFELSGASLALRDLGWPARAQTGLRLTTSTPGGGKLEARGHFRLDTQAVDLRLSLAGVDLAPLQPYVSGPATIAGKVDAALQIKGSLSPLGLAVLGQASVADATLGDGQRTLASAKRLEAVGVNAEWPRRVAVEKIGVDQPWALVERNADGSLALLAALRSSGEAPAPPGAGEAASPLPPSPAAARPAASGMRTPAPGRADPSRIVEVGAVELRDGFVRFVDRTTSPSFVEEASRVALTARGLTSSPQAKSHVALGGQLLGGAPFNLEGLIGALGGPLQLDVKGVVSRFPLSRANPYASKVVGWIARRGALDATIDYRVRGEKLEARNDVVMGGPEFVPSRRGDEVRRRLGLPLDLLVSLLKDARGDIRLSVPVAGNFMAGELDWSDTVWDAVRKAVINVIALPVSWVGKIFYTADARIDTISIWPVTFEPGSTRMLRDIEGQARRLSTFLKDAPSVVLAMKPVMTVDDVTALRRDAVRKNIQGHAEAGQGEAAVAARLFAERFPGQPVPTDLDVLIDVLARDEPSPQAALADLAERRIALTKSQLLERSGAAPDRLRPGEGVVPVETSGPGRVEFELVP